MNNTLKYGVLLGGVLLIHYVLFYLYSAPLFFVNYNWTFPWFAILYLIFMVIAIYKSRRYKKDSGTYFKIGLIVFTTGMIISQSAKYGFVYMNKEILQEDYIAAAKMDTRNFMTFIGENPLNILEEVELLDDKIEEEFNFTHYLTDVFFSFLLVGIPYSILVASFSKWIFKYFAKFLT